MFDKLEVKGPNVAPIYQYLNKEANDEPKWNFHKYLVDKEGNVVKSFSSKVKPFDNELLADIKS